LENSKEDIAVESKAPRPIFFRFFELVTVDKFLEDAKALEPTEVKSLGF